MWSVWLSIWLCGFMGFTRAIELASDLNDKYRKFPRPHLIEQTGSCYPHVASRRHLRDPSRAGDQAGDKDPKGWDKAVTKRPFTMLR